MSTGFGLERVVTGASFDLCVDVDSTGPSTVTTITASSDWTRRSRRPEARSTAGSQPRLVVVERNGAILRFDDYEATGVAENDSFELVHFVGGG